MVSVAPSRWGQPAELRCHAKRTLFLADTVGCGARDTVPMVRSRKALAGSLIDLASLRNGAPAMGSGVAA